MAPRTTGCNVDKILAGETFVATYPGISQYSSGGVSACGLAALNATRLILNKYRSGFRGEKVVQYAASQEAILEIMAICAFWPNSQHLELDQDVFEVPLFKSAIMQYGSTYGVPSRSGFQSLINKLNEQPGCTAVLITRPPEILACLKIPFASGRSIYAVFDSHPRPDHRDGAAIFFSSSPNVIISRLHDILEVDPSILTDSTLQWQAQLLSNFSGHFFVPTKVVPDADEVQSVLMETSLSIIHLRAENLTFRSRQRMLTSENARLEEELEAMHEKYRTLKLAKTKSDPPLLPVQSHELTTQKLDSDTQSSKPDTKLKGRALDVPSGLPGMALSTAPRNSRNGATSSIPGPSSHSNALIVSPKDALFDESAQLAYDLQQEDDRLFAERQMLIASSQIVFTCSICLEQLPEDSVARVENCGHKPCRDCMRQYIVTRIDEQRFPILCPGCTDVKDNAVASEIDERFLESIGIPEEKFQAFTEHQLAAHSIYIICRRCKEGMFVDKAEYEATEVITCPLRGCNCTWCKACHREIDITGPKHSCDGTSELDHLVKQEGWKYCPGCKIPVQKNGGCNHMLCMGPGCNTHFCYVCGALIVKSVNRREIQKSIERHYRACHLFEH